MRRFLDKWGTAIAAVACALTIVFAAVYTRQDDLKRIAAQEARAAQDQSLQDARQETVWARPVPSAPSEGFRGAYRDEHGLWLHAALYALSRRLWAERNGCMRGRSADDFRR